MNILKVIYGLMCFGFALAFIVTRAEIFITGSFAFLICFKLELIEEKLNKEL